MKPTSAHTFHLRIMMPLRAYTRHSLASAPPASSATLSTCYGDIRRALRLPCNRQALVLCTLPSHSLPTPLAHFVSTSTHLGSCWRRSVLREDTQTGRAVPRARRLCIGHTWNGVRGSGACIVSFGAFSISCLPASSSPSLLRQSLARALSSPGSPYPRPPPFNTQP